MLWHSLSGLEKHRGDGYDVVVVYSSPSVDLHEYQHLGEFNLVRDYPKVKFIVSDYHDHDTDRYLHKWYNFDRVFDLGYDQVLFMDCDMLYQDDPKFMFEKCHQSDKIYALFEGENPQFFEVLGRLGMSSGQIMMWRDTWRSLDGFYQALKQKQHDLCARAREKLDAPAAEWFRSLSEQYSAQMVFLDHGLEIESMDQGDICYGVGTFEIEVMGGEPCPVRIQPRILHYISKNDWLFVPKWLWTENMHGRRRQRFVNGRVRGDLH